MTNQQATFSYTVTSISLDPARGTFVYRPSIEQDWREIEELVEESNSIHELMSALRSTSEHVPVFFTRA